MDEGPLHFPMKALSVIGLDPRDSSWFAKIKSFLTIASALILAGTSMIQMGNTDWDVDTIVPLIEAFVAATQVNPTNQIFLI